MYIDITKNIYDKMISHQFVMSVMGNFNQEFLRSIIRMTEKKLDSLEIGDSAKRRIFHFMVECAQNLCKHEKMNEDGDDNLFLIGKKNSDYLIFLGYMCDPSETLVIKEITDKVNLMPSEEIKNKFFQELGSRENSKKSALLVSLLDISKRTKEKVNYEIIQVDLQHNFLCFKTIISGLNKSI